MRKAENDNQKVVRFSGSSRLEWSTEEIFRNAQLHNLTEVIVIGRLPNGQFYLDHAQPHPADVNWVLDQIKDYLLDAHR